jgi:hypothetical protein
MRRKTIKKMRGVHFRAFLLCSYVRASFASPLQSPPRRVCAAPKLHCSRPARQLLSRQRARTAAAAVPRPTLLRDLAQEKSVHFRRSDHCLSDGPKDPSRRKVCPLSRLAPLFLRGPSRKLPSARARAVAPVAWAQWQGLSAPSPSGTPRVLLLNKNSGRIWPAPTTGR